MSHAPCHTRGVAPLRDLLAATAMLACAEAAGAAPAGVGTCEGEIWAMSPALLPMPDARSMLRETEVRVGKAKRRVGHRGRWLHPAESSPESTTVPAHPVRRANPSKDRDERVDWAARATGKPVRIVRAKAMGELCHGGRAHG